MSKLVDFNDIANGLTTEKQRHIAQMVRDASGGLLELKRIPEGDPAFRPPHVYGVYERNVAAGLSHWVFTLMEMSIDERVVARVLENDMRRHGANEKMAKYLAFENANKASELKVQAEKMAEREDEMKTIGKLAGKHSAFRHTINGQDVIIGDTIRPVRRHL